MTILITNEARKKLYQLIDQVAENHEPTLIKGKRNTAVLISEKDWQDIEETLFVANNTRLSKSLLKGLKTKFEDCKSNLDE